MSEREVGDLRPVHELLRRMDRSVTEAASVQPSDPKLEVLRIVRGWIAEALEQAQSPEAEISIEELAELEGVTVQAIYKRRQRGKLPHARKRNGRLYVPVGNVAA